MTTVEALVRVRDLNERHATAVVAANLWMPLMWRYHRQLERERMAARAKPRRRRLMKRIAARVAVSP